MAFPCVPAPGFSPRGGVESPGHEIGAALQREITNGTGMGAQGGGGSVGHPRSLRSDGATRTVKHSSVRRTAGLHRASACSRWVPSLPLEITLLLYALGKGELAAPSKWRIIFPALFHSTGANHCPGSACSPTPGCGRPVGALLPAAVPGCSGHGGRRQHHCRSLLV